MTYDEAQAIRDKIEDMKLTELLAINPTMRDMYHISQVLLMGYGKGHAELDHDFYVVEKLLKAKRRKIRNPKKVLLNAIKLSQL